jgi:poly-gamma-glutamate capsule biosynthesis protein CapA/YwtB (metallophosphatase superfamily)
MPAPVRRAAIASVTAGALCVGAVVVTTAAESVPNPAAGGPHVSVAGSGDGFTIAWLGDTLLGDAGQPLIDRYGPTWPAAHVPPPDDADLVIANAEGPLTDHTVVFDPLQRWSYQAQPRSAGALAKIGIDAVSLANNHIMDRGPVGLFDTIANARAAGLVTFGGGATSEQARLPLMIKTDIGTIAVVGFADDSGLNIARRDRPGIRQLNPENIVEDIRLARRAGADRVVAHVQWGENYAPLEARQRALATALAAAGYDLVIGLHPHVVQPIEIIDGVPVVYSLGNYVFTTPGRFTDAAPGYGLVLSTEFDAAGRLTLEMRCIQTDNEVVLYQPRPCDAGQARALLGSLNSKVVVRGDVAQLKVPAARS